MVMFFSGSKVWFFVEGLWTLPKVHDVCVYEFAVSSSGGSDQVDESFSQLLSIVRSERQQLAGGNCDGGPITMETDGDASNASLTEDAYLKGINQPRA